MNKYRSLAHRANQRRGMGAYTQGDDPRDRITEASSSLGKWAVILVIAAVAMGASRFRRNR